jgi:hypothetical protein
MASVYKFTTGTGSPAAAVVPGTAVLCGLSATCAEAAAFFIKFWWPGNTPATTTTPTVGTTVPSLTIAIPTSGLLAMPTQLGLNNGGPLYYWVTKNAADSDNTALTTGGDVISLFLC